MAPALALHPRGACQECAGMFPCAAWVGRGMDVSSYGARRVGHCFFPQRRQPDIALFEIPTDAEEICAGCNHKWFAHHGACVPPQTSRAFEFVKGVCLPECGGFYSVSPEHTALSFPLTPPASPKLELFHVLCLHQTLGGARTPVLDSTRKVCLDHSSHAVEPHTHYFQARPWTNRYPDWAAV